MQLVKFLGDADESKVQKNSEKGKNIFEIEISLSFDATQYRQIKVISYQIFWPSRNIQTLQIPTLKVLNFKTYNNKTPLFNFSSRLSVAI